jgi:hypothetical protein
MSSERSDGPNMPREADLIARVEDYVRHPAFNGSDEVMRGVLRDLEARAEAGQIGPETYARLRDLILGSNHFRRSAHPAA